MYFYDISHTNSWMLFILVVGIVSIYHKSLMHVRSKFTLCQKMVNWAIFAVVVVYKFTLVRNHHWPQVMQKICVSQACLYDMNQYTVPRRFYFKGCPRELRTGSYISIHPNLYMKTCSKHTLVWEKSWTNIWQKSDITITVIVMVIYIQGGGGSMKYSTLLGEAHINTRPFMG